MNWLVFIISAYLLLAIQIGLQPLLAFPGPQAGAMPGVSPNLVLVLLVWVGLMAPARTVLWASLVLGVMVDVTQGPVHGVQVIGPTAIGYVAGGITLLQIRGIVFRESVLTLAVSVFFVGLFVYLATILIYTLRGVLIDPLESWRVADALVRGFQTLLYTALAALPLGFVLFRLAGLFAFPRPRSDRYY